MSLPDDLDTELRRDAARRETHNRPDETDGFDCGFSIHEPLAVAAPGEVPTCDSCMRALVYRERLAARAETRNAWCLAHGAVTEFWCTNVCAWICPQCRANATAAREAAREAACADRGAVSDLGLAVASEVMP